MKVVYFGPAGTFSQQAAGIMCQNAELIPASDIDSVFETAMCVGTGIVPLENSTEGVVNATLDALLKWKELFITEAYIMPIRHTFIGHENPIEILAHPQALAQCKGYLRKYYPNVTLIPSASNGEAARLVAASDKRKAAIGPLAAAKVYNLPIIAENIQDQDTNSTTFIKVQKAPSKGPRTSIAFSTENKPGDLLRIIRIFDKHKVNMCNILSRPLPQRPGEYVFFVDLDDCPKEILEQVKKESIIYRFIGSYLIQS